jgi:hypothetical protein
VLPHADTFPLADVQSRVRRLNQRVVAISEAGGVHIRSDEWIAVGPGGVTLVWSEGRTVLSPRSRIPSRPGKPARALTITSMLRRSRSVAGGGPFEIRWRPAAGSEKARTRKRFADAYEVPLIAAGVHRFTGVTLEHGTEIITGLPAPKVMFQFDAGVPMSVKSRRR